MSDPLARLLACTDLDDLLAAFEELVEVPDESGRTTTVIEEWSDEQAVANLLMCASVIPREIRAPAVLRGLHDPGYLQLAAAVGAGRLPIADLDDDVRRALLDALLDLVASDAGPAGVRASAELGPYLRADEVELLDDLAGHPVDAVRHNVTQARLSVTDPDARQPVLLPHLPAYQAGLRATT